MGTWNPKPFGNDTALDWLAGLDAASDGTYLAETLDKAAQSSSPLGAEQSEEALAAAAVIAAAATHPIGPAPAEAKTWIRTRGFVPSHGFVAAARTLVQRIVADSELRELWRESGSEARWLDETNAVIERLQEAAEAGLPQRTAKPCSLPRLLYRMVALQASAPDHQLQQRIRSRLLALEDVDAPSKETNFEPPLCMLARTPLVEEARLLILRRADPNTERGINTPLVIACSEGQVEMAKALLDARATLFKDCVWVLTIEGSPGIRSVVYSGS
jgi:hypothetical protein